VHLPAQSLPDLGSASQTTIVGLLLAAAPVAGIIEESAFRGYMQTPIERRFGLPAAVLITGTMFALAHLDFTPVLWPYYMAVAAIYGAVTSIARSILPAIVLHTAGNLYSNFDLYLYGQAEWQAPATRGLSASAIDSAFWLSAADLAALSVLAVVAFCFLKKTARQTLRL